MSKFTPTALFDNVEQIRGALKDPAVLAHYLAPYQQRHDFSTQYESDYRLACEFLYSYRGSEETFKSYRRDLERLLQWAWLVRGCSIQQLKRQDIEHFIEFCQQPPKAWIGGKHLARFLAKAGVRSPSPEWRPFVIRASKKAFQDGQRTPQEFSLSQSALRAFFAVLSSFYNFLIQEEVTESNPVAHMRQKSKFIRKQQHKIIRRLSDLQWQTVIGIAGQLAEQQPELHERTLFIMTALYAMYLRISELVVTHRWEPQMGHFQQDIERKWWFYTVGKGNKERQIAVSDQMLMALKRYRKFLGLSALPTLGESTPLLSKVRGQGGIGSTRAVRKIVQHCFDQAVYQLRERSQKEEAERLQEATVHWLRHTGISDDVKVRPREHVRDDAGHSSSAITDRYIDIELRERHASAKPKKVLQDESA